MTSPGRFLSRWVCVALVVAGCQAQAAERRAVTLADLPAASLNEAGVWESAPWESAWIPFGGQVTLDIEHGLGKRPYSVLVYLSFDPNGRSPALAAGDLSRIGAVNEQTVTIQNGTKGGYYLRLVLQ